MKKDDSKPETKPAGNKPPPRPPRLTTTGLAPEEDGPGKKRRFGKNCRATIAKAANGEGRFIRRSAGRRQYGHVQIWIEPNKRGKGIEVIYDVPSEKIPAKFSKSIVEGIRESLGAEMVIGDLVVDEHSIDDVVARAVGGSFDETDSNELAFKLAGIFAVKDALKKTELVKIE